MRIRATALAVGACLAVAGLIPAGAQAAPAPAWSLSITPLPANFSPTASFAPEYLVAATNVGAQSTAGTATLSVDLPIGLAPIATKAINTGEGADPVCTIAGQKVTCQTNASLFPGARIQAQLSVAVSAAPGTYDTKAQIEGGGVLDVVSAVSPTPVQAEPVPFAILPGFIAPLSGEDGKASALAGSHPFQQTVSFSFPTRESGVELTNDGYPRDIWVELPRGLTGNLGASPVLCTEVELSAATCPKEAQIGVADVITSLRQGINGVSTTALYNMVPPPGAAAEFATDVAEAGLYLHTLVGVRSDGDYGVEATSPDLLALGTNPVFGAQVQVWGDPSSPAHDKLRLCKEPTCPAAQQETALLTAPADCPGTPLRFEVLADTWEEPFPAFEKHRAAYESAELDGTPVHTEGCGDEEVQMKAKIEARADTILTDSPAGLDFDLRQDQNVKLDSRSPAPLRDALVRFPAGLAVNPAQAGGLGACSLAQIGFLGRGPGNRLDFSKAPQSCPEAAKIGTMEVTSPSLVARNAKHEVAEDPEGNPVLEPLHGSIYLARPFANPFGSLVGVYLVVEDKQTGIVAKLAGKGELNPQSGQITTRFEENPEIPIAEIKVHIFGGARGPFTTPPTCGEFAIESQLTPWSAPDGDEAFPTATLRTSASPLGGACPATEAQLPNAPKLSAGTESPAAGKYSPLLFKVSRSDATQRLGRIEATLPTGLIAKLAGVASCPEGGIARARSREESEKGRLELADPSCPGASRIGTVVGSAGSGPNPYYTTGSAYLAGPYKGAPISIVAIVPALAGPFDLGAVVARSAVYLDPLTAQGRVLTDPLPTILQGVPLDLRSVAVRADRPGFSLNPTSCAQKSFGGQVLSTLGSAAALFERFQVGGCKSLPYKPKMSVRLFGPIHRGGHPSLKAVFTAKAGEANTKAVSFAFPKSEFIDQAHFRTICTRVQFAANQCPAGSVYGHVRAFTPLLDYPLEGPVYLRSSSHKLPDVVVSVHGPPSQPIAFEAAGRVDSINGGLRVRFESIPDAPLSKLVFTAQGAKKGLFQNSTNICKGTHRATLKLDAQSGKVHDTKPLMKAQCPKGKGKEKKAKGGGGH